jgi:hypothetical protein
MKFDIKKFDMSSIPEDKVVVFIGARGNGKSWLVKDMMYYHQSLNIGTVICPTEEVSPFYREIVPKQFIHDECTPELINKVIERQKLVCRKMDKEKKELGESKIDPRAFIILDDCLYDSKWTRDKYIRYLFMNGRHIKLFCLITSQYALGLPPNLRTNIDYTFILRENNMSNRERLYKHYAGCIPTFEMFCQLMNACTENFECLVIHNSAKSNKLEDQVFWYKADNHEKYRIGAQVFWEIQAQQGSDSEDDNKFNPQVYHAKRNRGPYVTVQKRER